MEMSGGGGGGEPVMGGIWLDHFRSAASSIPPSPSRLGSTAQRIVGQILPIYLQIYLPARAVLETTICVSKSSSSLRLVLLPFWTRVGTKFTPWPSPNNMTGNKNAFLPYSAPMPFPCILQLDADEEGRWLGQPHRERAGTTHWGRCFISRKPMQPSRWWS